jgi:inner membrane protein
MRWLLAITLALVTHPLLDAHTAYGTQLFWPLTSPPVMWSTIFIIDPLFTLPLLIGVIAILVKPDKTSATRTLAVGIALSTSYLTWTWSAKQYIESKALESLDDGNEVIAMFSTPTPFNSLLWRVVLLEQNDYLEGYYSLLDPSQRIEFTSYSINKPLYSQAENIWSAKRLDWFAQGFIKSMLVDDYLVISDLRMGFEGNYVFNHAIAKIGNPHFHEIESKLMPSDFGAEDLGYVWKKLVGKS